jgi:hypothetical protein
LVNFTEFDANGRYKGKVSSPSGIAKQSSDGSFTAVKPVAQPVTA